MKQKNPNSQKIYLAQKRYSYSPLFLLGKGATGNVYKGIDQINNKQVAIKVIQIHKMNQVQRNLIQTQKRALKMVKHENIMKVLHIQDKDGCTFIISDLYQGGSLKDLLSQKGKFSQQEAMQFFRKIINGYCAIVEANIIHRDLKPANILLTNSHQPIIIDFGYSQIIVANKNLTVFNVGSPSYMSPQAFKKTIYSQKSDIWSLGAIFYELLTNSTLDQKIPTKQYFQNLQRSEYPSNIDSFSDVVKQILKGSLAIRPQKRVTSHRIKYLLDKEIIGKNLTRKMTMKTDSNQKSSLNINFQESKTIKNLDSLLKQIDFLKLKQEENKNMKRKAGTAKTFSNFPIQFTNSNAFNNQKNQKQINKLATKKQSIENFSTKNIQKSPIQQRNISSSNKTPQISRMQFASKRVQNGTNSVSSIKFIQKKVQNKNTFSTLSYRQVHTKTKSVNTFNNPLNNNYFEQKSAQPIPASQHINNNKSRNNQYYSQFNLNGANLTYSPNITQSQSNQARIQCNQAYTQPKGTQNQNWKPLTTNISQRLSVSGEDYYKSNLKLNQNVNNQIKYSLYPDYDLSKQKRPSAYSDVNQCRAIPSSYDNRNYFSKNVSVVQDPHNFIDSRKINSQISADNSNRTHKVDNYKYTDNNSSALKFTKNYQHERPFYDQINSNSNLSYNNQYNNSTYYSKPTSDKKMTWAKFDKNSNSRIAYNNQNQNEIINFSNSQSKKIISLRKLV